MVFIYIIIAVILTEAVTELVVKSYFFEPVRKFFYTRQERNLFYNKVSYLLECGYCFSVWAGAFSSITMLVFYSETLFVLNYRLGQDIIIILVLSIVVHRLSNMLHYLIDRLRGD